MIALQVLQTPKKAVCYAGREVSRRVADSRPVAYLEHLAVGSPLAEMPLFLDPDRYINLPLEATYLASYHGMPAFWRDVLEGRQSLPPK